MANPRAPLRDRVFGATQREKELDLQIQSVETVLRRLLTSQENKEIDSEFGTVAEGLAAVDMMLDAKGWHEVFSYDDQGGLSLSQIQSASQQLRELMIGNPFVQNGSRIRNAAVWGGGVEFACKNRTGKNPEAKALPASLQNLMEEPRNWLYIFGNDAHDEMERAAFSDGNFFALGDEKTKNLGIVPIFEIKGDYRNPFRTGEILAYRRVWYQNPNASTDEAKKKMVRWYYTDLTPVAERKASITFDGKSERVERQFTILDKGFNRQVGWAYGVPDALAIVAWSRLYKEFLVNGYVMSRSLARLAFKVTVSSAAGGAASSTSISTPGQAGGTAIEGMGNKLAPLETAGKGYDFASGSPLAAAMAAGLGVSLLALTSNPAAASGSNAAAQTLGPIERATAHMRRRSWDDYWVRVFRWMGLSQRLVTTWSDLPEDGIQRILQAWTVLHNSGLFAGEVVQAGYAKAMSIAEPGKIPDGYMLPNNEKSLNRKDVDSDGQTQSPTAGSGQGQSNPGGKQPDDHDDDEE